MPEDNGLESRVADLEFKTKLLETRLLNLKKTTEALLAVLFLGLLYVILYRSGFE